MSQRLFRRSLAGLLLLTVSGGAALAHAVVKESDPAPNAVVHQSHPRFTLHFNSRIDLTLSTLTLLESDGAKVKLPIDKASTVDTLVSHGDGLAPGSYRIRWQVLSVDGHITRGDIPFTVAAASSLKP